MNIDTEELRDLMSRAIIKVDRSYETYRDDREHNDILDAVMGLLDTLCAEGTKQ